MSRFKLSSTVGAFALSAALIAATLSLASDAAAETRICGPRDKIIAGLTRQYQEKQNAIGLAANGHVVEVFVSREGSWTMLMSSGDGTSCVLGSGEAWQGNLASYDPEV